MISGENFPRFISFESNKSNTGPKFIALSEMTLNSEPNQWFLLNGSSLTFQKSES